MVVGVAGYPKANSGPADPFEAGRLDLYERRWTMALVPRRNERGSLTPWRGNQHPLDLFRQQFDSLFDNFFRGWPAPFGEGAESQRFWDFDVQEDDKEVVVRAEMPGFEENEMDVQVQSDVLTIKAEKQQQSEGQRSYRSFFRSVTLPPGVDAEQARATYRNGVLELHLPRQPQAAGKRIPVQGHGQQSTAGEHTGAAAAQGQRAQKKSGNGAGQTGTAAAPAGKK
jgi:HSP20 family protein